MEVGSVYKALTEGFNSLNAKASISTNAINKYIEFSKNAKVQQSCNNVNFVFYILDFCFQIFSLRLNFFLL
jgi:hypothetical protein